MLRESAGRADFLAQRIFSGKQRSIPSYPPGDRNASLSPSTAMKSGFAIKDLFMPAMWDSKMAGHLRIWSRRSMTRCSFGRDLTSVPFPTVSGIMSDMHRTLLPFFDSAAARYSAPTQTLSRCSAGTIPVRHGGQMESRVLAGRLLLCRVPLRTSRLPSSSNV